jgi:hypothetical protein
LRGRRDEKLSISNNTGRGAAVKLEAATLQQTPQEALHSEIEADTLSNQTTNKQAQQINNKTKTN